MLYEFVTLHREAIMAKARHKLISRPWPPASAVELESGLPLFLTQLSETLRLEATDSPFSATAIGTSATRHGSELLARGFTVSQVVHDYGDICQAITELAQEENAPITAIEFQILNRCLDTAIADAVTEHARITAASQLSDELERVGRLTHEIRNTLNSALLAFAVLKQGTVGVSGSTGAVPRPKPRRAARPGRQHPHRRPRCRQPSSSGDGFDAGFPDRPRGRGAPSSGL